jgi:hypothetical protein
MAITIVAACRRALFDQLHNLGDPEEVVRRSAAHEVDFLPPGSVPGA